MGGRVFAARKRSLESKSGPCSQRNFERKGDLPRREPGLGLQWLRCTHCHSLHSKLKSVWQQQSSTAVPVGGTTSTELEAGTTTTAGSAPSLFDFPKHQLVTASPLLQVPCLGTIYNYAGCQCWLLCLLSAYTLLRRSTQESELISLRQASTVWRKIKGQKRQCYKLFLAGAYPGSYLTYSTVHTFLVPNRTYLMHGKYHHEMSAA